MILSLPRANTPKRRPSTTRRESHHQDQLQVVRRSFFCLTVLALGYVSMSIVKEVEKPKKKTTTSGTPSWAVGKAAQQRHFYTKKALENHNSFAAKDVLVIAHRGCRSRFPENSLPAIAACAEEGAQIAEVDVDVTSDGVAVLLHDRAPDRVSNVAHWKSNKAKAVGVNDLSLKDVKQFWLTQSDQSSATTPFKIPTLAEAVAVAKACGIHLLLRPKKSRPLIVDAIRHAADITDGWSYVVLGPTIAWPEARRTILREFPNGTSVDAESEKSKETNVTAEESKKARRRRRRRSRAPPVSLFASYDARPKIETLCGSLSGLRVDCTPRTGSNDDRDLSRRVKSHIPNVTIESRLDVAAWIPTKSQKTDYAFQRTLRAEGVGVAVSFLWEDGGEFHLRDFNAEDAWPNATREGPARVATNQLDNRCPPNETHHACLGARLWIPTLKATAARFAITDMPGHLRAALLEFGNAAPSAYWSGARDNVPPVAWPMESWPVDPPNIPNGPKPRVAVLPPKCLALADLSSTTNTRQTAGVAVHK